MTDHTHGSWHSTCELSDTSLLWSSLPYRERCCWWESSRSASVGVLYVRSQGFSNSIRLSWTALQLGCWLIPISISGRDWWVCGTNFKPKCDAQVLYIVNKLVVQEWLGPSGRCSIMVYLWSTFDEHESNLASKGVMLWTRLCGLKSSAILIPI